MRIPQRGSAKTIPMPLLDRFEADDPPVERPIRPQPAQIRNLAHRVSIASGECVGVLPFTPG